MKLLRNTLYLFIIIFTGCASNMKIQLLDKKNEGVPEIPIEILDENGKDRIDLDKNKSDENGELEVSFSDLPDSFLVKVKGADYFEENEWIKKEIAIKEKIIKIILEQKITIITGYVLDAENMQPIQGCRITTLPEISEKISTDKEGKFIIKSKDLSDKYSYTIFADKHPDYMQSKTTVTPKLNDILTMQNFIELEKIAIEKPDCVGMDQRECEQEDHCQWKNQGCIDLDGIRGYPGGFGRPTLD